MIKASEVRIGNWVNCYKATFSITAINNTHVEGLGNEGHFDILDCKPIPLTPEILEQAGFEKDGEVIYRQRNTMLYFGANFVDYYHYGHPIKNDIQSLHQLQNLFYALSGTELTINLNDQTHTIL